jgi:LysR family glycine cleavage system transcriptional activator
MIVAPNTTDLSGRPKVIDLRGRTLIHTAWLPEDDAAPTWKRWLSAVRAAGQSVPEWGAMKHLTFREEAHAIEAAIAGQGLAMCSDVLVAREFANGRLVRFSTLSLPGYGFVVVSLPELALDRRVLAFREWVTTSEARDLPEHRDQRLSLRCRRPVPARRQRGLRGGELAR